MEKIAVLVIPALMSVALVRLLVLPVGWLARLGLHSGAGFLCLWLLNSLAPFSGVVLPVNAVTVLISGFLGLPGIGVVAILTAF